MSSVESEYRGRGRPRDPQMTRQRRETILDHAVSLFARQGFPNTEVGAIAEAAGCAKGTIYNYFSSKRELFRAAMDQVMRDILEATAFDGDDDPLDVFRKGIRSFFAYFDAHPENIEMLIQERAEFKDRDTPSYLHYRNELRKRSQYRLQQLIEKGIFRPVPVDATLDLIENLLFGTIFTNYYAGCAVTFEEQASVITDTILHGLLAEHSHSP